MRSTFVLLALAATAVAARPQRRTCSYSCPEHDAFGGPLVTGFVVFGQLQCTYLAGVCTYSASTGAARIPSIGICHSTAVSSCSSTSSSIKSSATTISSSSPSSVKPSTSASASMIRTSTISTSYISISSSSSSSSSASSTPSSTSAIYTPTSSAITVPTSTATTFISSPSSSSIKSSTSTSTSAIPTSSISISSVSSSSSPSTSTSSASSTSATYTSTATSTTASSLIPTIALPAGWSTAYGCAVDTSSRVLGSSEYYQLPNTNTPATCIALCGDRGFSLAGVEYGYECFCASSYVDGPPAASNVSDCNVPCAGDASQTCGGGMRLQIYSKPDALAQAAALPSGWKQTSACSVDTPARVFADTASTTLANNTPAHCIQHCSATGYKMAGVEDSDECYCGSSYANGTAPPSASLDHCSSGCKGAPSLTCGGEYAIQLYATK